MLICVIGCIATNMEDMFTPSCFLTAAFRPRPLVLSLRESFDFFLLIGVSESHNNFETSDEACDVLDDEALIFQNRDLMAQMAWLAQMAQAYNPLQGPSSLLFKSSLYLRTYGRRYACRIRQITLLL